MPKQDTLARLLARRPVAVAYIRTAYLATLSDMRTRGLAEIYTDTARAQSMARLTAAGEAALQAQEAEIRVNSDGSDD